MKLRKEKKKEFENSFTTFYIFERNGWIIDSIHLHLLNIFLYQWQVANIISYIIILNLLSFLRTSHYIIWFFFS
jgi:hypothetical protein